MKKWIFRLGLGVLFALPFMFVTGAWVQAEGLDTVPMLEGDENCQTCHPAFHLDWSTSAHGMAADDTTFVTAWQEQGEPLECLSCHTTGYDPYTMTWESSGVTCKACHSPYAENHPGEPMPADRSSELCGECHTEAYFEWQVSKHRQMHLDCVDCHGQHSTSLKAEDASALCSSCHQERSSNFAHTAHSEEGLTCADCHLALTEGDLGEGHAARDHSFNVKLSTCNECHTYEMHDPSAVHTDEMEVVETPDAMSAVESAGVSFEPDPVSPVYFVLLAALIGMAFGLLVAPWIERWYHRMTELRVNKDDCQDK